ncbi:peptidoglycan DD-metalloendopeptidase family protein [Wukongibacter sp. M2B1]|uniref:peptidoglycan DD-metalloendopeptidase family protein n=1 Tax=Wukongibacter sp. M2B1 TaxID=3088895 RepID=UPI003D7AF4A8
MDIFKKFKSIFKENFTFVIIPHDGKKTKQFNLYKPSIYLFMIFFIITSLFFVTSTVYLFATNNLLSNDVTKKADTINRLNDIVNRQHSEIEDLKNTSNLVIEKLSELHELENKIRTMVGLGSKESAETSTTSRSFGIFSKALDTQELESIADLTDTDSIDAITSLINSEKEIYDTLITDVEKQLKFLDSRPDIWPVTGKITSPFGYRIHPISRRRHFHQGIDIANKAGTKVVSAGSGIVTYSGWNGGYGKIIIISHGYGYKSVYAHNSKNLVEVGDKVKKGQEIAKLGNTGKSTGSHLHFEVRYNGEHIDPLNLLTKE